ncbi:unnamed protein product [Hymenolepis diminuta]|uniref:Uncharacterized protein n=1 Tax=Hymenolepis diminuta TaxID=6216 RepID=A0A564YKL0_HYMDI|nr:unnamed protein product [Hymenolepis diminuta]VUZ47258.1 unnamed protein product [Hymenolepis diminuta]VUZ52187.1 unnamed protein product [Hymenolepis diminuta]VUZ52188.1 unnamed protein product [Hymenolepis diminuta]
MLWIIQKHGWPVHLLETFQLIILDANEKMRKSSESSRSSNSYFHSDLSSEQVEILNLLTKFTYETKPKELYPPVRTR